MCVGGRNLDTRLLLTVSLISFLHHITDSHFESNYQAKDSLPLTQYKYKNTINTNLNDH